MYAWENPGVPVDEVVNDVLRAFHHPAARNEHIEIQRDMFEAVRKWTQETPYRNQLGHLLSSESVKNHKNHVLSGGDPGSRSIPGGGCGHGDGGHGKPAGSLWAQIQTLNREQQSQSQPQQQMHGQGQAAGYYAGGSPAQAHHHGGRPGSSSGGSGGYAGSYGQPTPSPSHQQQPYGGYPGQGGYGQPQHQPHYGGHHQPGYGAPPQHGGYPPHGQPPPPGSWGQYPRY
jgi:hypothetical protein